MLVYAYVLVYALMHTHMLANALMHTHTQLKHRANKAGWKRLLEDHAACSPSSPSNLQGNAMLAYLRVKTFSY